MKEGAKWNKEREGGEKKKEKGHEKKEVGVRKKVNAKEARQEV